MVTAGVILLILGILGTGAITIKAMGNMQNTVLGKRGFDQGFNKHIQAMKIMVPCALMTVIGIVLVIVGICTR